MGLTAQDLIRIRGDKAHPFPAPDGRWLAARYLAENRQRVQGRWDDPWIHQAVPFLQMLLRRPDKAAQNWPALYEAHLLYSVPPDLRRWELEARLLTPEPFFHVAAKCSLTPAGLEAYHALFFNVRDRLRASAYILHEVIGPKIHHGLRETDIDVILKWLAYLKGELFLDLVLDCYRNAPVVPEHPELLEPAAMQALRDKYLIQAMIVSATLPTDDSLWRLAPLLKKAVHDFEHGLPQPQRLVPPRAKLSDFQVLTAVAFDPVAPVTQPLAAAEPTAAAA